MARLAGSRPALLGPLLTGLSARLLAAWLLVLSSTGLLALLPAGLSPAARLPLRLVAAPVVGCRSVPSAFVTVLGHARKLSTGV